MTLMEFCRMNAAAMLVGFALDLLIGDPEGWPHPVVWIGRYISQAEKRLRARGGNLRKSAIWLTASTALLSMAATAAALALLQLAHKWALFAGMCVVSWWTLSTKCLAVEARGVRAALETSLEQGRARVARIVGRDTSSLSEDEGVRATVETVAENATDGVIAPMLYLLLGGPVLAMGFKAVSTLDSMVGYLDAKYRDIGWSSARLDALLNYVPPRISGVWMGAAALLCGLDGKNALRVVRRDHANHLSPNCAWSEAAMAGALHIRLGGAHSYFGNIVEKPTIGDDDRPVEIEDISRAVRLLYATAISLAAAVLLMGVML